MSLRLSNDEIKDLTGYSRKAEQLEELHRRGFYRAYRDRLGRVVLERAHFRRQLLQDSGRSVLRHRRRVSMDDAGFLKLAKGLRFAGPHDDISQLVALHVTRPDRFQQRLACSECKNNIWEKISNNLYTCWNCGHDTVTDDGCGGWQMAPTQPKGKGG